MRRVRFWSLYSLAWAPYAVSYYVLFSGFPEYRTDAWLLVVYNILPAALLGVAVLRWCRWVRWEKHRLWWFYPVQLGSAVTYSAVWWFLVLVAGSLGNFVLTGRFLFGSFSSYAAQWQSFSGLMVYGNLAGFAYVGQVNRTLVLEERRRVEAESLKTRAELAALRAQLNPHFLFNTLNSLLALAGQNPAHAQTALAQLASMLRYALNEHRSGADDEVSLREEMAFTDDYLALEGLRLGDRLRVCRRIDAEALGCRLPALTVQPLVENAIRHGIGPRARGGTVTISAEVLRGVLHVSVSDDGVGAGEVEDGLGLRSVRQRLALFSEGAGGFLVQTAEGEGFCVLITLPLEVGDGVAPVRELVAR